MTTTAPNFNDLHNTPAPKKKRWFTKPVVLLPIAALALGSIIGQAGEPKTVEVEKRVEVPGPERTVTKEVKVEVPTTPAACLEALDINEQAFTYLSESLNHVLEGDYSAANASTERVKGLVSKVNTAKAECRAS